jgi:hypothetical protein
VTPFLHLKRAWRHPKAFRGGLIVCALLAALLAAGCRPAPSASVVNYETKHPIPNATIFHAGKVIRADAKGEFGLKQPDQSQPLLVRAAGFWPKRCDAPAGKGTRLELEPLETRGLYLSYAALGLPETRARALQLLDGERLNTLVVDVKDRQGRMTFYNGAPNAGQIGAFGAIKFDDAPAFLKQMHQRHIYVVGRLAAFHDPLLAKHNPEWAVRAGKRPSTYWPDPYRKEVRDYMLAIVKEAATVGFDEIELDCVWFPGERELPDAQYARANSVENRVSTIQGFLAQAADILAPYNVALSLAPEAVVRWEGERSGKELELLTQSVQCFDVPIRNLNDLATLNAAAGFDTRQLRAYLECGSNTPGQPSALKKEVKDIVKACRAGGLGGWVLYDSKNQYSLTRDSIRELAPSDL